MNRIMIYIALALLGLFFSCDNPNVEKASAGSSEWGDFEGDVQVTTQTYTISPSALILADLTKKLPQDAFGLVEDFSANRAVKLAEELEKNGAWKLIKARTDYLVYQNNKVGAKVIIRQYKLDHEAYYLGVYQLYEQASSMTLYQSNGTKELLVVAKKVLPAVAVNDFLMPQHQSDSMETYSENISFMLDDEGQIQASLHTWMEPAFEEIVDLNDVLIHWRNGVFVKEIIPVE